MRYYRDSDYFLYIEPMPVARWLGFIDPMPDGTVCIYVNTRVSEKRRRNAIKHELRHLAFNHMWAEERPIEEIEAEADAEDDRVTFGPGFSWVECEDDVVMCDNMAVMPLVRPLAPANGSRQIPLFASGKDFFEYYIQHASEKSLELLRRAGWNGDRGA